jgi:hypothetical protein
MIDFGNGISGTISQETKKRKRCKFYISSSKKKTKKYIRTHNMNITTNKEDDKLTLQIDNNNYDPQLMDYAHKILHKASDEHKLLYFTLFRKYPTKEISECMAPIHVLLYKLFKKNKKIIDNTQVTTYVFGDGRNPKIGFFLRCIGVKWNIVEIDPLLYKKWTKNNSLNIIGHAKRDLDVKYDINTSHLNILIAVHSHGDLNCMWNIFSKKCTKLIAIAIPCCSNINSIIKKEPIIKYQDDKILSPCNEVYVWSNTKMHNIV